MVKKEIKDSPKEEFKESEHDENAKLAIERYYKLKRPAIRIMLLSIIIFFCFSGGLFVFMPAAIQIGQNHSIDRIIFILYASIFIANWLVYFRSKKSYYTHDTDGIQSLRRLLGETSRHWQRDGFHDYSKEKHDAFKNKSSTSMTVIAIEIAVSVLILTLIRDIFYSQVHLDSWQMISLHIAAILAVVSFFSFVVSIDALDTIFNRFKAGPDEDVLIYYFYNFTINPKYIGMVSMITTVIVTMQIYSTMLASISIAISMCLGYYLWYPKIDNAMIEMGVIQPDEKTASFITKVLNMVTEFMVVLFLVFPLFMHFLFVYA